MKKAWMQGQTIKDVAHDDPYKIYHPDIAKFYTATVPDNAENGDNWDGVTLAKPTPPTPSTPVEGPKQLNPVEFKQLFTSAERIAIKTLRATDAVVDDFFSLVDDPRLITMNMGRKAIKEALNHLESVGVLTLARKKEILKGEIL